MQNMQISFYFKLVSFRYNSKVYLDIICLKMISF